MPESITSPDTGLATVSPGPDPASTNRPQPCRTPGPVDPVRPALLRHRLGPVGRLDIIASADGRLIPASRLKIVQPAEAGVIREILASEGQRVRAGQLLMCMDSLEADTDLQSLQQDRERTRLALARVQAELDGSPFQPAQAAPADLAREVLARYRADQQALHGQLAEAQARHLKARRELAAAQQQKQAIEAVLPYYRKQATSIGRLAKQGLSAQSTADEKERQRLEKEAALATQQRLIESAQASIALSEKKIERLRADHILTLRRELDQTGKHLAQLGYRIRKQRHRQAQLSLRAPHDGVIKQLATHAMGTVVQPGTVLASLVPDDNHLQAEIWLSNKDIGFVHEGQPVQLKVAAYPFQKYGLIEGRLSMLSADAQSRRETQSAGFPAAPDGSLRYRALVDFDRSGLQQDGQTYPLYAGMQVTGEIRLGTRRVADYLLSPISRAWHEAGRER